MKDRIVYSTEFGQICPDCSKPIANCSCAQSKRGKLRGDGNVVLRRETKGRGGKTVSIISGLAMNQSQLEVLGKELKKSCGSGGTVKDGEIEIQGDHLNFLRQELTRRGLKPRG